jgi:predicted Ser/Thr protein kinase
MKTAVAYVTERTGCLDPITAVGMITNFLNEKWGYFDVDDNEVVGLLEDRLNRWVVREIRKAYVPDYESKRERLFADYQAEATLAYYNRTTDNGTGQQRGADLEWLEKVENGGNPGITLGENQRKQLRGDLLGSIGARMVTGAEQIDPVDQPHFIDAPDWLREGIDGTIFNNKMIDDVITKEGIGAAHADHVVRYGELTEAMKDNELCEHCIPVILTYAKNNSLIQEYKAQ